MARYLDQPNQSGGTTSHTEEIALLYDLAGLEVDPNDRISFGLAADLLLAHDETGISLDNWPNARQFVEYRIGQSILQNHV